MSVALIGFVSEGEGVDGELYRRANAWSRVVIGAAMEVHRSKGPGLVESIYNKCFGRECDLQRIPYVREERVPIEYKGLVFEDDLRLDYLIDRCLLVELKAVEAVLPIHKAQLLSYMRLLDKPLGLLINFHEQTLKDGVFRLTLAKPARKPSCPL